MTHWDVCIIRETDRPIKCLTHMILMSSGVITYRVLTGVSPRRKGIYSVLIVYSVMNASELKSFFLGHLIMGDPQCYCTGILFSDNIVTLNSQSEESIFVIISDFVVEMLPVVDCYSSHTTIQLMPYEVLCVQCTAQHLNYSACFIGHNNNCFGVYRCSNL